MSTEETGFTLSVHQNKFLAQDAREMEAVIKVTAAGLGQGAQAAEVLLVDCSGSMDMPPDKIIEARKATRAAIDALRDGVLFAIVRGTAHADVIYPTQPGMVAASPATRSDAKRAVTRLTANGGTAMGRWLTEAARLLEPYPHAVRHAMLFTDGRNEHETPEQLGRVLDAVRGRFVCDVRGIGEQLEPAELLRIVAVLNGRVAGIAEIADLTATFRELMQSAMAKVVPEVDLRMQLLGGARLRYLRQLFPSIVDKTGELRHESEPAVRLKTGAWANETREYQVCVEVDPRDKPRARDNLAARVGLEIRLADGVRSLPSEQVLVHWTDEPRPVTEFEHISEHYDRQRTLEVAVVKGCAAARSEDRTTAEAQFAIAVRLATEYGNRNTLKHLRAVVDIDQADEGLVRLKSPVREDKLKILELIANESSQYDGRGAAAAAPPGPPRVCPACSRENDSDAKLCEQCQHRFEPDGSRS